MSAPPWQAWMPLLVVVSCWVFLTLRARLAKALRRRRAAAARSGPAITDGIEAHIAVGSLSGIAPSDIQGHVLLVVTHDGNLGISGTACGSLRTLILAKASTVFAEQAFAAHDHDHGRER
jgi:hypothetical protein